MAIITNKLVTQINCKLETEPSLCSEQLALIGTASKAIDKINSVATFNDLPPASENTGRFVFVENEKNYYFSTGFAWSRDFSTTQQVARLWTWGSNFRGLLGDGSTTARSSPGTTDGGGTGWCQADGIAAIKIDGTLWTWGPNSGGNLGDGSTTDRSSPGTTAGGGTNWCQVSGGVMAAVKQDGTLWTWGYNACGQLGTGDNIDRSSPGTTAGGGTDWCQVSGRFRHMTAVKTDGTLWTWGCNNDRQLGDGTTIGRSSPGTTAGGGTNWCQVNAGIQSSAGIKTDGTLWTWGSNFRGLLGDGTTINRCSPVTTAGGGTDWCQVSAGTVTMAAVKQDGTLWTWGCNTCGLLGTSQTSTISRSSPGTTAGGGTDWCQVDVVRNHMVAVKTNGTLWTWGGNDCGQLGTGGSINRSSPGTTAGGGTDWCQASVGVYNSSAVTIFLRQGF